MATFSVQNTKDVVPRLRGFFREVGFESKKVVWPDRKYVVTATGIILFIVAAVTLFVWGIDLVFARIFNLVLRAG